MQRETRNAAHRPKVGRTLRKGASPCAKPSNRMPLFVEYSEPKTEAKPHDNPKTGASACSSSATPSAGPKQLSAADHHAEADACCHPPELAAGKPAPALIGMVRPESHLSTPMHLHRHPPRSLRKKFFHKPARDGARIPYFQLLPHAARHNETVLRTIGLARNAGEDMDCWKLLMLRKSYS